MRGWATLLLYRSKMRCRRAQVKKGTVLKAVIVRTAKDFGRKDGTYIRFSDNAAVLIKRYGEPSRHPHFRPGCAGTAGKKIHAHRFAGAGGAVIR